MRVKDSDGVWESASGWKADSYDPLGLVDQCLVELRGLVCVLFGSEELVCIRGWGITYMTKFRGKCVAGLPILVWLFLRVSMWLWMELRH